jgi:hypothetical protein
MNYLKSNGYVERPPRSLETKWDLIKHYVSKFVGVYNNVASLNELGSPIENPL